ncbi:MAG: hypothetical protein LH679_12630 [Cyanobacteria bacterium CAN_BIN43]|jgi:hypothetical protein|nr:hypothetical protein [Cyanobacteria bacterium CAN_BIN43]
MTTSLPLQTPSKELIPIVMQKVTDRCHVVLPGTAKPTSAITFDDKFYIFVKFFASDAVARQKADLMVSRGNQVVLTRVPKGLVLWTLEADAELVNR